MQIGSQLVVPAEFTLLEGPRYLAGGAVDYRRVLDVAQKVK
jgi:hypothetical protein